MAVKIALVLLMIAMIGQHFQTVNAGACLKELKNGEDLMTAYKSCCTKLGIDMNTLHKIGKPQTFDENKVINNYSQFNMCSV